MKLMLFDIDGTLIRTAGAGKYAMEKAFQEVYGFPDGLHRISMMGRTDPSILREAMCNHGLVWNENKADAFRHAYYRIIETEIHVPRNGKHVCAGIIPLLKALSERKDIALGLLTGNWKRSAYVKLAYFKIDTFFPFGAFADDSEMRPDLVPVAIRRFEERAHTQIPPDQVYIIGDTPLDIDCGRQHHTRTIAVATGFHTYRDLAAHKPDFIFESFADTDNVLTRLLPP